MCLAVPARVVEVRGKRALVEWPNEKKEAVVAVEGLKKGDFVLLQQGIAVEKVSEKEAKESWKAAGLL